MKKAQNSKLNILICDELAVMNGNLTFLNEPHNTLSTGFDPQAWDVQELETEDFLDVLVGWSVENECSEDQKLKRFRFGRSSLTPQQRKFDQK